MSSELQATDMISQDGTMVVL